MEHVVSGTSSHDDERYFGALERHAGRSDSNAVHTMLQARAAHRNLLSQLCNGGRAEVSRSYGSLISQAEKLALS